MERRNMADIPAHIRSVADHDGAVILDISKDQLFSLNPVGAIIWERLLNGHEIDEISKTIAAETGTEIAVVTADVNEFIAELKSKNLVHSPASDSSHPEGKR